MNRQRDVWPNGRIGIASGYLTLPTSYSTFGKRDSLSSRHLDDYLRQWTYLFIPSSR
jgi:hypothetical protein